MTETAHSVLSFESYIEIEGESSYKDDRNYRINGECSPEVFAHYVAEFYKTIAGSLTWVDCYALGSGERWTTMFGTTPALSDEWEKTTKAYPTIVPKHKTCAPASTKLGPIAIKTPEIVAIRRAL